MMKHKMIAKITLLCSLIITGTALAQKPELKFNSDKKFKIVQFTDTHIQSENPESQKTIKMMNEVLDKEKPDLVVYTGDVITGDPVKKGWEMVTEPVVKRGIPFAVTLGNHDDEQKENREQVANIVTEFPGSLFVPKTKNVYGYGNYVVGVKSSDGKSNEALLYFMDSNAYATIKGVIGYGWFDASQVNWYLDESKRQREINGKILPALAFFHIPLKEYHEAYRNEEQPPVGLRLEDECMQALNTGLYAAMLERKDVMGVFVGHDHNNDYIATLYGVALAYGRFSGSKTTYGDLSNGARIIELTEGQRAFKTWIRTVEDGVLLPVNFPADFPKKKKEKE